VKEPDLQIKLLRSVLTGTPTSITAVLSPHNRDSTGNKPINHTLSFFHKET